MQTTPRSRTTVSDLVDQLQYNETKDRKPIVLSDNMKKKLISLKAFANQTSAHGIKNATSGSAIRRVIWFIAVFGACGFLIYNLVTVFVDYSNYPFRTVFKIAPRNNVKFPAVTICKLNKFDAGKYAHPEELRTIQRIIAGGPFKPNLTLDDIKEKSPYDAIFAENYWNLANTISPTIEETFVYCAWRGEAINCTDHISYIVTPIGRCFQFNQNDSNAKVAIRPGSRGGFSAILNIKPEAYVNSEHDATGIRILLHDQYDYPDVFSRGILFSPGFTYYVSFLLNSFNFLAAPYKAFSDAYCSADDNTDYAPEEKHYSMKSCIYHKASATTFQRCGCGERTCSVLEYYNCYKPLFEEYYENTTTSDNIFSCPFACKFAFFDPVISSAAFPSEVATDIISHKLNMTSDSLHKSLLEISLFFEDFVVRESNHVATYGDWFSIMAMLGGNMGLFLGASLLTFGELIELILIYGLVIKDKIVSCCGTRTRRNSVVNVRPRGEEVKQAF